MITLFFTGRKLIVLDVLPKGRKYNQLCFVQRIFPDFQKENTRYKRRKPGSAFSVHRDNSMAHNRSKVESKFGKHGLFRMPHPPYSPDISPCDFWLFGMSQGIFPDREFTSSEEIEEAITMAWNDLTFEDGHTVFRNWISHLVEVIENGRECVHE
jgi:hypothetical protein